MRTLFFTSGFSSTSSRSTTISKSDVSSQTTNSDGGWTDAWTDDESLLSPLSARTHSSRGTHWSRSRDFPELDSHQYTNSKVPSLPLIEVHALDIPIPRQSSPSLSSEDNFDSSSSCYSRRSSLTSQGSEPTGSAFTSADAFSIADPTAAGVFDDAVVSAPRTASRLVGKRRSMAEVKNKPLPCQPPIDLAPLQIRRKHPSSDRKNTPIRHLKSTPQLSSGKPLRLSQVAEDLEDVLAGMSSERYNRQTLLQSLDTPLQISRGKMDMIATRPAPQPPVSVSDRQKNAKNAPLTDVRRRVKSKMPFSFGRKHHQRSLSSSDVRSEVEIQEFLGGSSTSTDKGPSLMVPEEQQRPSTAGNERELRQNLSRLWTMETRSHQNLTTGIEEKIFYCSSKTGPSNAICELDGGFVAPRTVFELDAGITPPRISVTSPGFTGTLPNEIILSIMQQVSSLDDLFNIATHCKQYYYVFKKHELELIKNTVYQMSAPAWELREMNPPWDTEWQNLVDPDAPVPEYTPASYLQRYAHDMYTLVQLKLLILARCSTFLRPETIQGLAGNDDARAAEIDAAFWRIWTFCRIFGCGKNRESDVMGQLDWLNGGVKAMSRINSPATSLVAEPFDINNVLFEPPAGFGRGNKGGLSQGELYDMMEMWTCLSVLLQPIHGKRNEARQAGIFAGLNIAESDAAKEEGTIEEWISYVLTLGPSAVLQISSVCPVDNAEATFQKAASIGLTKWEPSDSDTSRSTFLKEAVSKAYGGENSSIQSMASNASASSRSTSPPSSRDSSQKRRISGGSSESTGSSPPLQLHRRRQAIFAAQLRNRKKERQLSQSTNNVSFADERPISSYSMIVNHLDGRPATEKRTPHFSAPPVLQNPPAPSRNSPPPYQQVFDPVDRAIHMMVQELGFNEEDAKWALKLTDSGEGIDTHAAVSLLNSQRNSSEHQRSSHFSLRPRRSSNVSSVSNQESGWRFI